MYKIFTGNYRFPVIYEKAHWASEDVIYTGIMLDIEDDDSNELSKLIDIRRNGESVFSVSKGGVITPAPGAADFSGFVDYNNTVAASAVAADTWFDLPNNGAGAFTNTASAPSGVSALMDFATGAIDPTDLNIGDTILVRNDYTLTPTINNALVEFRYKLGTGAGEYTLPKTPFRLNRGAGVADRVVSSTDLIYMGDENTRGNPIQLQIKCSAAFTVQNAGSAIAIIRRG